MCGIVGEMTFRKRPVDEAWVRRAVDIMAHRGPDGTGFHTARNVAFGHRRLAIIDLTGGIQPMAYAGKRYWITYNGEIYNYLDLKSELSAQGCAFQTNSDTEVILAAYAAWGPDSFRRLNGIFSLALWDESEGELVLARDHLGIKPLLYHADSEGVCFGSELKVLLAHERVGREIDHEALHDYLALGYVLAPKTILADVRKLPAGHYLRAYDGHVEVKPYWNLAEFAQADPITVRNEADVVEEFAALVDHTVRQQMVSEVPLGAFLSGGIDSSTISYFAARAISNPLKTFSIGFDEKSFSELDYAQAAADTIHTDHRQQIVRPLSMDELGKLVWFYDEPLGDSSIIATYFVAKLAREQVTVTLSGDGGDEILAGYDTYVADRFQRIYAHVPGWMHRGVVQPMAGMIPSSYRKLPLDFMIKQFVSQAHGSAEAAHYGWRVMFPETDTVQLMGRRNGYMPFDQFASYYADVPRASDLNRSQYVDIKTWLVDDILTKVDRASMAVSLEARVPFLAPPVVEYAMRLPSDMKLRGFKTKHILKQSMKNKLPDRILNRKKRGFTTPISLWMRDSLRGDLDEMFAAKASALVDLGSPAFQRIWSEHVSGKVDHGYKLWSLLSLLLWEREVLNPVAVH